MGRLLLRVAWCTALALAVVAPAGADLWYEHYAAAERALAAERWADAIQELNSALEKKGDSGARARTYGMRFEAYFPYLKLGIAYFELGQLDAALQAFETEEQLGAIAQSAGDREQLESYRGRALEAQRAASRDEARRVAAILRQSLAEAGRLDGEGRIEEAISALGPALAVAPADPDANEALARLRRKLAVAQQVEDRREEVASLSARGRALLAEGRLAEASSVLRQALALADDETARGLLDEAQRRLRSELEAEARSASLAIDLEEATELWEGGRLDEALERLQSILAVEPANRAALDLQQELLAARAEAELARRRSESVAGFVVEAEEALGAGRFEDAMKSANRTLALEAGHPQALEQLARAYRALNERLLGGAPRQNFPPAIRFADRRAEMADGTMAELTHRASFRLSGVVIDDTPVDIAFSSGGRTVNVTTDSQAVGELFLTEFRLAETLARGSTVFRLVATDEDGLTSTAEYSALYRRPLSRSPWLYGYFATILAATGGLLLAARIRRRRRLRRRRFNPYTAGAPVLDERLFFGRQKLIDRILQTLPNNSLLLHGERRIGKTTLQHQLKKRLEGLEDPDYDFYPVFIDLQGTPEERFFATLCEEIFQGLAHLLDGLEPRKPPDEAYSYRDFLADLRAVLKILRRRSGKRVRLVLLIDEVDELNSYDPRVNQKLRSLFMKSFAEDLVAVVSGVSIKREWDREGSPWYNFFEEIDVGPLRPGDARELVERPIRGLFRLDDGAIARILELSDGRPFRIQQICMQLVNHMYEAGRRRITAADVEAIAEEAG